MFINNVLINNNGCHINRCCVSCIMYADDLILLSSSVTGLQKLLDVSVMTAKNYVCNLIRESHTVLLLDLGISVKLHLCTCMINQCSGLIL